MSWWSMQNGRKHWRCVHVTAHPRDLQRIGRFSFPRGQINYVHFSLNLTLVLVTERWISYNWSKNLLWGSAFELKLENGSVSHRKIAARKVLLAEKWAVPTTPSCDGYLLGHYTELTRYHPSERHDFFTHIPDYHSVMTSKTEDLPGK